MRMASTTWKTQWLHDIKTQTHTSSPSKLSLLMTLLPYILNICINDQSLMTHISYCFIAKLEANSPMSKICQSKFTRHICSKWSKLVIDRWTWAVHTFVFIQFGYGCIVCVYQCILNLPLGSQITAAIHEKREPQPFITTTWTKTHIHCVWKIQLRHRRPDKYATNSSTY